MPFAALLGMLGCGLLGEESSSHKNKQPRLQRQICQDFSSDAAEPATLATGLSGTLSAGESLELPARDSKQGDMEGRQPSVQLLRCKELTLLQDALLFERLGSGGYAACYRGVWQDAVLVAVKVVHTHRGSSSGGGAPPLDLQGEASMEAVLAKHLSHPNIVQCFDVRCAYLTPVFLASVLFGHLGDLEDLTTALATWDPVASGQLQQQYGLSMQQLARQVAVFVNGWQGSTPLFPPPCVPWSEEDGAGPSRCASGILNSHDGFGPVEEVGRGQSWRDVLRGLKVAPEPGDSMSVMIMAHCDCGTLEEAIKSGVFRSERDRIACRDERLRLRAFLRTAREVGCAMHYLHTRNVVHGDLKPANVLLQGARKDARGFHAKVADFGLSALVVDVSGWVGARGGTLQYMAPELFSERCCSHKSDIYSFGILLWTMISHTQPSSGVPNEFIPERVCQGMRPTWPPNQHPGLEELYHRCVDPCPDLRPTAAEVVRYLVKMEGDVRKAACKQQTVLRRPTASGAMPTHRPPPPGAMPSVKECVI